MRRRARVDENHRDIVRALRAVGCSVLELHQLGRGVPDLLVGCRGVCRLLEVKCRDHRGRLSAGAARSAIGQSEWAAAWRGSPVFVVYDVDHALQTIGLEVGETPLPRLTPKAATRF